MIDFTNMTVEQFMEQLSPAEFIHMAETEKAALLDAINAYQLAASWETSKAKRAYYKVWKERKDDIRVQPLRSEFEYWNQVWEGLKHSMSGLQSTLKNDREMQRGASGE